MDYRPWLPPPIATGYVLAINAQNFMKAALENSSPGNAGSTHVETCAGCGGASEGADAFMGHMGLICSNFDVTVPLVTFMLFVFISYN